MTAPRLLQPSGTAQQGATAAWFHLTCKVCHKVWLGVLVLSFLSGTTSATSDYEDVLRCLEKLTDSFQDSTAMLYAPSVNTEDKCEEMSLKCYLTELMMVIGEQEINNLYTRCIDDFNAGLLESDRCLQCEVHPQQDITTFLKQLRELLERLLIKKAPDPK
ncbi:interleukin-15 isoform X2 [Synchiropus splendidus]|uniref:interleukin-15 isoform X2 n=1 Tax=Synchiropus splendidus TaxID=270530 RepID=UPI00237D8F6A|nr:interleukin-15 isoform X2 [Synchiropus splendidus]